MQEFDIYALIKAQLESSFEADGVKGRVFFMPLTDEQQTAFLDLDDNAQKNLYAATHGLADSGERVSEKYGEAIAVAAITHESAPDGFVELLASYVIKASDLEESADEGDLTQMSPSGTSLYSDDELNEALESDEFEA